MFVIKLIDVDNSRNYEDVDNIIKVVFVIKLIDVDNIIMKESRVCY